MQDIRDLTALQLDGLREVANIGAGHAATALSQMTNRRIMISVPRATATPLEDVAELLGVPRQAVAAILLHMMGDLTGRTLLVFPVAAARRLCDLLLRRASGATTEFGALERSSLEEAGNIMCGAFMNALSSFMGMVLLPSVPSLVVDLSPAVIASARLDFGSERDDVLCLVTEFHVAAETEELCGHFLLVPELASLRAMLQAVRLT